MRHVQALRPFIFVENDRGDTRSVPARWTGMVPQAEAEKAVKAGDARYVDSNAPPAPKPATAKPPPPPMDQEVSAALQEIFPTLSDEEWGKDRVPNVKLLITKLSDRFGRRVALSGADRDAALEVFRTANPDLFTSAPKT